MELHINKPFEVCLSPVLPILPKLTGTKEKVGDEPGLNSDDYRDVLNNLAGINRKKNERNYW
jgi:hypothetical protein